MVKGKPEMMQLILFVATIIGAAGAAAYLFDRRRRFKIKLGQNTKAIKASGQTATGDGPALRTREKTKEFEEKLDRIVDQHRDDNNRLMKG